VWKETNEEQCQKNIFIALRMLKNSDHEFSDETFSCKKMVT